MTRNMICAISLLLCFAGLFGKIKAAVFDSTLVLEDLITHTLDNNPDLKAATENINVYRTVVPQSASFPDPQLTFGILNLPTDNYNFTQEPMTQKTVGLSQEFPFFGKLGLQERLAEEDVRIGQQQVDRLKYDLVNRIKQAYFMLWFLDRSLAITDENLVILTDLAAVTEAKYRVGKGFQQDLLKTQLEDLHLKQGRMDIEEKIQNTKSELNILLNRLPQTPIGSPVERPLPNLDIGLDSLQNLARLNNPELQMAHTQVTKFALKTDLSKREYWPDFRLGVNYGQRKDRPDFLSGLVTVNLPLYAGSKQSERVQQYRLSRNVAENHFKSARNEIFKRIKNLYDRLEKTKKLIALYKEDILPQSQQALTSAMAAYQTDQVEFVSVLLSQVQLHQNTLNYYQQIFEYQSAFAEMEKICGKSLTGI